MKKQIRRVFAVLLAVVLFDDGAASLSLFEEHGCTSVKRSFSTGMSASSAFFASSGVANSTIAESDSGCSYA